MPSYALSSAIFALLLSLAMPCQQLLAAASKPEERKCLYVSSYHQGYAWSDEIAASISETLAGACELRTVDMDTKRKTSVEDIFSATNRVIKLIEDWQPDVVIASDDNAAKYLIAPHYRDDDIPFVFCGVNWTVEEYGFPYSNVTGMVEVAPIKTMLLEARKIAGQARKVAFITNNRLSEIKNFNRLQLVAKDLNIEIEPIYSATFRQWKSAMRNLDDYDFAVLGSNAGIEGWDDDEAHKTALEFTNKLTVTNDKWMMPYVTFGYTKIAREQGEWAAAVAIAILNGVTPAEIPLASNKKWDLWVNEAMLQKLSLYPGRALLKKAKRLQIATNSDQ